MTLSLLLTPARSGVYRAPEHLETVRKRAAGALTWVALDLAPVRSKTQLLELISRTCGFPGTFGLNWDALADALQDTDAWPAPGYVLHLQHCEVAASTLGAEWAMLLEVLQESAHYWKSRGKPFIVFVDPAAELPPWL